MRCRYFNIAKLTFAAKSHSWLQSRRIQRPQLLNKLQSEAQLSSGRKSPQKRCSDIITGGNHPRVHIELIKHLKHNQKLLSSLGRTLRILSCSWDQDIWLYTTWFVHPRCWWFLLTFCMQPWETNSFHKATMIAPIQRRERCTSLI